MTRRTCIAIIDASRARLFVHGRTSEADGMHDQFDEHVDLVNPARRTTADDHLDSQFARTIVAEIVRITGETGVHEIVVCASPHMLGLVRDPLAKLHGIRVSELARDLTKLDRDELRQRLTDHGLLPELGHVVHAGP